MRKFFVISIILVLLSGCTQFNRTKTYLMSPSFLGMKEIVPKVFVNHDMSLAERENVVEIVNEARDKIVRFYGGVMSSPDILACSTKQSFSNLGGTTQRGLSFGKSKILISPKGLTVPILAHEWSHVELRTRMDARFDGVFGMSSIPTWFDEGLAVVVSDEPAHSEIVWETIVKAKMMTPELYSLESLQGWNKAAKQFGDVDYSRGVPGKICVVYATAGHEVRIWYQRAGRDGLLKLIDKVKSDDDFERAFKYN